MSTDTTVRPIARAATPVEQAGTASRSAEYRARVDILRRSYRRRARYNGIAANGVSLLLVAVGAAVGLSPIIDSSKQAAVLGVAVILLEGVTRVLRPAVRAARARRVANKLDREFRIYDACGRNYRCGGPEADAAFLATVERILEQADLAEEHDDPGAAEPTAPRKAG